MEVRDELTLNEAGPNLLDRCFATAKIADAARGRRNAHKFVAPSMPRGLGFTSRPNEAGLGIVSLFGNGKCAAFAGNTSHSFPVPGPIIVTVITIRTLPPVLTFRQLISAEMGTLNAHTSRADFFLVHVPRSLTRLVFSHTLHYGCWSVPRC
ncbi:hypothetical protein DFH07DRAFT_944522 [Mycena maculata]|uniref:Uncharacterized protein n=1 Tax=Mycena maculata TaxID=230809 RepID=A0AAD7I5H2_9AGAR|nr:hypothetical protein DFH07DRAFT_944522 [Mycena maculata]